MRMILTKLGLMLIWPIIILVVMLIMFLTMLATWAVLPFSRIEIDNDTGMMKVITPWEKS